VIECWIENRQMIEFATPEMTRQYVNLFTDIEALRALLEQMRNRN